MEVRMNRTPLWRRVLPYGTVLCIGFALGVLVGRSM